ncbi:MAG: hypothetical protein AB1412_05355 [Pseudomonadota bacterium]
MQRHTKGDVRIERAAISGVQPGVAHPAIGKRGGDAPLDVRDGQVIEIHDVAPWLGRFVVTFVQQCIALRLPGHPSADAVPLTIAAWCAALTHAPIAWDEAQDLPRLRAASGALLTVMEQFPAPSHLLRALPPRPPQPQLPPPRLDPNRLRELRHRLAGLERKLKGVPDEHDPKHHPRRKN